MKALAINMNQEDKAFFGVTGLLGSMVEMDMIIQAQVFNEGMLVVLVKAGSVAFISGFVGLIGKKSAEWLHQRIARNKSET